MQAFDDFLPQFFVDDIDQTATGYHQIVQFVQI